MEQGEGPLEQGWSRLIESRHAELGAYLALGHAIVATRRSRHRTTIPADSWGGHLRFHHHGDPAGLALACALLVPDLVLCA